MSLIDPMIKQRLLYTLGVFQGLATALILGLDTDLAVKLHIAKFALMMPLRWTFFKKRGEHYFMCEFCYYVNLIITAYLTYITFVDPDYIMPFPALFVMGSGPLPLATVVNSDRMYFHSPQHLITTFIHISTSVILWKVRWYTDMRIFIPTKDLWGFIEFYKSTMKIVAPIYLVWFLIYFLVMFIIKRKHIENKGYKNMFIWITQNPRHWVNKYIPKDYPIAVQGAFFMIGHLVVASCTTLVSSIMFNGYYLNTGILVLMVIASIWSASLKYSELLQKDLEEKNK